MRSALLTFLVLVPALAGAQIPVLNVSTSRLTFITSGSGPNAPAQQVRIRNIGSGSLTWRASASVPWIKLTPFDGVAPATLTVSVETSGMAPADYRGRVTIAAVGDADDSPAYIDVTLNLVTPSKAAESPTTGPPSPTQPGTAAAPPGGPPNPSAAPPQGSGAKPQPSTAPPLPEIPGAVGAPGQAGDPAAGLTLVSPTLPPATRNLPYSQAIQVKGGTPPYSMQILQGRLPPGMMLMNGGISGVSMVPGNYGFTLGISDSSRPPKTATPQLLLRVIPVLQNTALVVLPTSVALSSFVNQRPQPVRLSIQSRGQPLEWHATTDAEWLRLIPPDGISPAFVQLEAVVKDMPPGAYVATVTISMEGVPNSPARIPVQLTVRK